MPPACSIALHALASAYSRSSRSRIRRRESDQTATQGRTDRSDLNSFAGARANNDRRTSTRETAATRVHDMRVPVCDMPLKTTDDAGWTPTRTRLVDTPTRAWGAPGPAVGRNHAGSGSAASEALVCLAQPQPVSNAVTIPQRRGRSRRR